MDRRSYVGKLNPNWRGGMPLCKCGKRLTGKNYKQCFSCYNKSRYKGEYYITERGYFRNRRTHQLQHRELMERFLGRPLDTSENIHHINGIRTDNRIKNLQLISKGEHTKIHEPYYSPNLKKDRFGRWISKGQNLPDRKPQPRDSKSGRFISPRRIVW